MAKEFKDWVNEFVENGADPANVAAWSSEASGGGEESTIAWKPIVDANGNISWTRTSSTVKPTEQNIKGPQGPQGPEGSQGPKGIDGTTYTPKIGTVTTIDSTESASASVSVNNETKEAVFNFAIPKGNAGKDGVQIDDVNAPSETTVWSSKKTSDEIADIESALEDKADKTELDGSKKLYITNTGTNVKFVKITSVPANGNSIDIHFKGARTNTTFEEETVRISKYVSRTVYDGKIIQKSVYAANGNTPTEIEANFLVILDDYSVWAHIASYSTAEIELYSYGRKQSIDGTEATALPSEVKYSMFNGTELATMDMFITQRIAVPYTVEAEGAVTINQVMCGIDGYSLIMCVMEATGGNEVYCYNNMVQGADSISVQLKNTANKKVEATAYFRGLYKKN